MWMKLYSFLYNYLSNSYAATYFSRNPWYNKIKILLREMKLKWVFLQRAKSQYSFMASFCLRMF